MKRVAFLMLLAGLLALIACGGAVEPLTAEDVVEEDLLAALLTIEDLPTGWAASEPAAFEARTPGGTFDLYCATLPARSIASATASFDSGVLGPFLFQNIVIYPDEQSAEDALNDLAAAVADCPEETDDEGSVTAYSVLSFPALGDQVLALRSTYETGQTDGARVRVGNAVIGIAHTGLAGVDSEQTEAIVRAAVEKFEQAR